MSDARARLLARLQRDAYRRGTFTLASGKTSDFFIDCKRVLLSAEGHELAGAVLCDALEGLLGPGGALAPRGLDAVAGVALGGCPLASAVALTGRARGRDFDALYVRKEAKDHGTKRLVEGADPGALLAARGRSPHDAPPRVALLEDVLTTGGSSLRAVASLEEAGYAVAAVLALVDRDEGGLAAVRAKVPLVVPVFRRQDFVA